MVSMNLSFRDCDGPAVVEFCGELDVTDTGSAEAALTAVAARTPDLVVDLAGLQFIDCCGLGVLVRAMRLARQGGGDMVLAAPQQQVRRLLEITGLAGVFSVFPSAEQAVSGARPAAWPRPAAALESA